MLRVALLTRGSPNQVTGGHLYHRRMAEAAPSHGAVIDFVSVHPYRNPLSRPADVVLVDSIAAWSVAPWVLAVRRRPPLAAVLHQPPGGVGQGRVRTAVQRPPDMLTYHRCRLLIAASTALGDALVLEHGLSPRTRERGRARQRPAHHGATTGRPPPWPPRRAAERRQLVGQQGRARAAGGSRRRCRPTTATLHLAGRHDVDEAYSAATCGPASTGRTSPDRVVVHGVVARDEVARLYAGADVFALTSYAETYGTVTERRWRPVCPPSDGARATCPTSSRTDERDVSSSPATSAPWPRACLRLATDDGWREELRRGARASRSDAADLGARRGSVLRRAQASSCRSRLNQRTTGPPSSKSIRDDAGVLDVHAPGDRVGNLQRPRDAPP